MDLRVVFSQWSQPLKYCIGCGAVGLESALLRGLGRTRFQRSGCGGLTKEETTKRTIRCGANKKKKESGVST